MRALKEAGVRIAVPLVSQGELVGMLNLGPQLGEREYSTDDRRLLHDLATQAAPVVRVAQLVRQQEADARERERMDQELEVARLIQQTLLPENVPSIPDWEMAAFYRPARQVGGDFYDFLELPDNRLGIVIGDVTGSSENALVDAYSEAGSDDVKSVVLNFTGLEYMNSGGIGLLVTMLIRANRQGRTLSAIGLSEHYRHIFELTRLNEAIRIYDSEAAALSASA